MSIQAETLSETDLLLYVCNICECYVNIAPIRMVDGKLTCGRCDGEGVDIPAVEAVMKLMTLPCRFKSLGCKQQVKWNDVQHELACEHNKTVCVVAGCNYEVCFRELRVHIIEQHKELVITPRQKIKVELSILSTHIFLYVDGNRVFEVSFAINNDGLVHCIRALCAKPQLRYHEYDISIYQNDAFITWCSQTLVTFEETTVVGNNIPYNYCPCIFKKTESVEISICIYIDKIAPPPPAFYKIMDNLQCRSCSKIILPYATIMETSEGIVCYQCSTTGSGSKFCNESLQKLLIDLDSRPLLLCDVLRGTKYASYSCTVTNTFVNTQNAYYGSLNSEKSIFGLSAPNIRAAPNNTFHTLYKNLMSLADGTLS